MMKWASSVLPVGLLLGVFCGPAIAITTLDGDAAALVSGSQAFVGVNWTADVDYAVYAPTKYPGSHPDSSSKYIYAYQVFNDSGSTDTLASLTISLLAGAGAANPDDDSTYAVLGGVAPLLSRLAGSPATSVQWVVDVDAGEHSTVLLFSSPYTYTFAAATLADGGVGDTRTLPTPLPEPATISLLVIGAAALVRRGRVRA